MKRELTTIQKRIIAICGVLLFVALCAVVFIYAGKPMIRFLSQPEKFRAWVNEKGILGPLAFFGMSMLQVFVAIIPGGPLEIAAGYAFGALEGTILCMISMAAGSMLAFWFVRVFGTKAIEVFFPMEKLHSLKFLRNTERTTLWLAIISFIPGTPKDLLCYFAGLTEIKPLYWFLISLFARTPGILASTIGGNALGTQNYTAAIIAFATGLILCCAGLIVYHRIKKHHHEK